MIDTKARWDRSKGTPEPIRALNRIVELDDGEPLVDLLTEVPRLLLARETAIPYARSSVAAMLRSAESKLPSGVRLGLVDAWRPLARQQRIYDFMLRCAREAHPNRSEISLRRTVCRWVAPTNQKAPPGHCTGGAIDVWLLDEGGMPIDVWSPYSDRYRAAPTFVLGLDELAAKYRNLLHDSMVSAGFSNCRDEWWHYSCGDAGWAVRTESPTCRYGLIELHGVNYQKQEALSIEALGQRPNPFL